jgi:radical SAM superfamily enzyme YgiQ (UPF0313 family)
MPGSLRYEIGPIRPPSEAYSLLVRFTRNCPWNKCEFCSLYKGRKFQRRTVAEIKEDIDTIKKIRDEIADFSGEREGSALSKEVLEEIFSSPRFNDCFRSVAVWMCFGAKNVFIQDANSLIMKPDDMVDALFYLQRTFPGIDRITSYSRSQTISQLWSVEDLRRLQEAGMTRMHIGMESAYDPLLKMIRKGVTKEQHITAGKRVREAGIELSEYVIPGLGGKRWSWEHAVESADALNQINPDFIRLRWLTVRKDMLLYKRLESGEFVRQHDEEILAELRLFIDHLQGITSYVKSDHYINLLEEVEGKLPEEKEKILSVIDTYFRLDQEQRLVYRLGRRAGIYRGTDDLQDQVTYARLKKAIREIQDHEPGDIECRIEEMIDQKM